MTAPMIDIHSCISQCHRPSRDQDELLATLQADNRRRSTRLVPVRPSNVETSQQVLETLQQRSNNRKRQLSSTAPSSPSQRRQVNRVHFEVDSDDQIVRHVQNCHEQIIITEEEEQAMWWHHDDTADFKKRARRASKVYQDDDYATKFKETWEVCRSESSAHLENMPFLPNIRARGLEMYMFPEEMVKGRQRVIRSVLNAQAKIPASMNPEHRAQLLSAATKRLTRPMRRLSRVLAIGDARVAAQITEDDCNDLSARI